MASVSEKIDERILRLLGLEDVFDLDYDTYKTLLKEKLVIVSRGKNTIPREEEILLREEFKRVRSKEGRFKPKKDKITAGKVATTKFLKPAKKTLALPPSPTTSPEESSGGSGRFVGIRKTLDSILKTLGSKFKFDQKQADQDRKEKETEKRGKRESTLEGFKKGLAGIVSTTKKLLDPFQAIIDRIWRFIFFTLLGRAFTKFMEWMGDKGNQEKFNSFIEFLSDHWPALAGLYVLFGTSFGKLVRGLLKGATRMIVALAMSIPKIFAFIRKNKKLAFLALAAAPLVSREIGNLFTDKETPESGLIPTKNPELDQAKQDTEKAANTKVPTLNLGGMVPKFNLGGMLPSFKMGGMDFSGGVPISGAGQDDTLIAAKTGEAILTEGDQKDIGQRYVDRTTGQPLNIPQYLAGRKPGSVSMGNLRFPGMGSGFFDGGLVSKFNTGGIIGMQGGGSTKVRAENPRMTSSRSAWDALNTVRTPLNVSIEDAKDRLLNRQASTNTNIKNNYRPWWQRLNPFADKRPFNLRIPHPPIENYRMPGFDLERWRTLDKFRETPQEEYKPNPKSPKLKYAPGTYHSRPGIDKPLMLQGGGEVTAESLEKTYVQGQKSGMSSETLKAIGDEAFLLKNFGLGGTWRNFRGSGASNMRGEPLPRKQGGGLQVKENTGMNIPGATADRQRIDVQPGEYVLPVDTVNRLGTSLIDKLVAMTDSNSNPYLGRGTERRPQITPYNSSASNGGMITLPPITQSMGGTRARSAGLGGGSKLPGFSATAPDNEREINASIYGLVG